MATMGQEMRRWARQVKREGKNPEKFAPTNSESLRKIFYEEWRNYRPRKRPPLAAVRFGFDDVGPFDGLTDWTRWNGWLNIWVTPETHAEVVAAFKRQFETEDMGLTEEDHDFYTLKPDADGLVCYAMGYTTSEWPEDDNDDE